MGLRISGVPRTPIWRSARAKATRTMPIPPSKLAATTSAPKFLSSRHETALCSSLTALLHCTLTASKHSVMAKLQMLYSWVVTGLFATRVGFTSPPTGPPSHPQQLWVFQSSVYGRPGSLVQPSRKLSDLSHISAGLNA